MEPSEADRERMDRARRLRRGNLLKDIEGPFVLQIMADWVNDNQSSDPDGPLGADDGQADLAVGFPEGLEKSGRRIGYRAAAMLIYGTADMHLALAGRLPHWWVVDIRPGDRYALRPVFGGRMLRGILSQIVTTPDKYMRFGRATLLPKDIYRESTGYGEWRGNGRFRAGEPRTYPHVIDALDDLFHLRTQGIRLKCQDGLDQAVQDGGLELPNPPARSAQAS